MTTHELMLLLGTAILTMAFRSYAIPLCQRLASLGVLATTFLAIHLLTRSWIAALIGTSTWFFLPWLDLLTRVRRFRMPLSHPLEPMPPPSPADFPALAELTEEVEREGFEHIQDAGWQWQDFRQFFRLFYHEEDRTLAAICLSQQDNIDFFYLSISSREPEGRVWITWNYPFANAMKLPPQVRLNRQRGRLDFFSIYQNHLGFLRMHSIHTPQLEIQDEDRIRIRLQEDLVKQIAHNLREGVLIHADPSHARYSWRGMLYLWTQFLLDFIRWR